MKFIYSIKNGKAQNVANLQDGYGYVVVDNMPFYEPHENCHEELLYDEENSLRWVYTPYTSVEMREKAYETENIILWDGELITVDGANKMWQAYQAEGSTKASELTVLIAEAKATIRERYPD